MCQIVCLDQYFYFLFDEFSNDYPFSGSLKFANGTAMGSRRMYAYQDEVEGACGTKRELFG